MPVLRSAGLSLVVVLTISAIGSGADDYTSKPVTGLPEGVGGEIAKALAENGHQITGPDGPLCRVWFVKSPTVKEGFKPTLSVKYPLVPGSLVGLLQVEEDAEFTDFREQELPAGLYTLRYGQQPQDGNHIGTSDLADFLLVVPAKSDTSSKTAGDLGEIVALSQDAAGSTHPAILALRPAPKEAPEESRIVHDSSDDLWDLETAIGSSSPLPIRLTLVGFAVE